MIYCNFCQSNPVFCIRNIEADTDSTSSLKFKEGSIIFDEGQQLRGIYCIKKGVCKISKMSAKGREQIIDFLSEGTLLGMRSLLNTEQTNLKAEAITEVEVCFVSKKSFFDTLEKNPNYLNYLLFTFADYLRTTDNRIVSIGQGKLIERLSDLLVSLHLKFGVKEDGSLKLYIKREDMASYIGVSTESAIRALKSLEQKGLLKIKGKTLRIQNFEGLEHLSKGF